MALWRSGAQALRSGDPHGALTAFRALIGLGQSDPAIWMGVAMACRTLGDEQGQGQALDRVLETDPQNLRALMMKADVYQARGEAIAAAAFYRAVARIGATTPPKEADLALEVARAKAAVAAYEAGFEKHLRAVLGPRGLERPDARRVAASLDLMFGKKRIFLQEPTQHYFPGLAQIEFFDRSSAPWLDRVEAATSDIRQELLELLRETGRFTPYVEREKDRPFFNGEGLVDNPDWSACFLWKNGTRVEENAGRCPKTLEALSVAPLCRIAGRTPSILFSLLRPGARIPPHNGLLNSRLICHLPLIVPEGCGFRVGNETRTWEEGRAWLFDDSVEHEAWNNSSKARVILIFDIWRPELSAVEQDLVAGLLEAVKLYSQDEGDWSP
jgi:aspartyl/asparaginyl beta-hydroxylase (cupin superfamily)